MGSPADIRAGLATSLSSLNVGTVYPWLPSNPIPPCAFVTDGPILYDQAMGGGLTRPTFVVVVLVAYTQDENSQSILDGLRASTGGVKSLIEADPTLGGVCSSLQVTEVTEPRLYQAQGNPAALGCEWTVEVLAQHLA